QEVEEQRREPLALEPLRHEPISGALSAAAAPVGEQDQPACARRYDEIARETRVAGHDRDRSMIWQGHDPKRCFKNGATLGAAGSRPAAAPDRDAAPEASDARASVAARAARGASAVEAARGRAWGLRARGCFCAASSHALHATGPAKRAQPLTA